MNNLSYAAENFRRNSKSKTSLNRSLKKRGKVEGSVALTFWQECGLFNWTSKNYINASLNIKQTLYRHKLSQQKFNKEGTLVIFITHAELHLTSSRVFRLTKSCCSVACRVCCTVELMPPPALWTSMYVAPFNCKSWQRRNPFMMPHSNPCSLATGQFRNIIQSV